MKYLLEHPLRRIGNYTFSRLTTLICGFLVVTGVSVLLTTGTALAQEQTKSVVLTTVPAPYSIASLLAKGTDISVQNIPENGRRMYGIQRYLHKFKSKLTPIFSHADAVVTIGKLWRKDPLYAAVRAENVRVVNIDATRPWSSSMTGVSVIDEPDTSNAWSIVSGKSVTVRRPSIYFWMSLANGARMADIIATDFIKLYPQDADRVKRNLTSLQSRIHALRLKYEKDFATVENLSVISLTCEFVYLTDDTGIYVDSYLVKQDIQWTDADLAMLTQRIKDNAIPVVIHKWMPSQPIQNAIKAGGAELVILDPLDGSTLSETALSSEYYLEKMEQNLETLYAAFKKAGK